MNARLNAFIVPDLLLTQPPLSSPTSYPTCCSRSYQFHRTRPAAHAATLINTRTQPAAAAMGNYRNALLNTPSADTHVSGLTRCSGDPADTDISAVHAAAFIDPDLLLTQPPSSYQLLQLKGEDGSDPLALMRQQAQLATKLAATGCALPEPLLKALLLFALPPELSHLRTKYIDAEEAPGHPMTLATLKQRLTTQFQSAVLADPESIITPANTAITKAGAPCEDPRLTPELMEALVKLASNMCAHCGGVHKSEKCWIKFPALRPADMQHQANLTVPMF